MNHLQQGFNRIENTAIELVVNLRDHWRSVTAAGTLALTLAGCSLVDPDRGSSQPTDDPSAPGYSAKPFEATEPVVLIAKPIIPGPVAAEKDVALDHALSVGDVLVHDDTAEKVREARRGIAKIMNPTVQDPGLRLIDARLATTTIYADYLTYAEDVDKYNAEESREIETGIALIKDPKVRSDAELNLDLAEAEAVLEAVIDAKNPDTKVVNGLKSMVEDRFVADLLDEAVDGNKAAAKEMDEFAKDTQKRIEDRNTASFVLLYNGSRTHADGINAGIKSYLTARKGLPSTVPSLKDQAKVIVEDTTTVISDRASIERARAAIATAPNATVKRQALKYLDASAAEQVEDDVDYVYEKDSQKLTADVNSVRDGIKAITNEKLRQAASKRLDHELAETASIDEYGYDPEIAAAALKLIADAKVVKLRQAANGGDTEAEAELESAKSDLTDFLNSASVKTSDALYAGSNAQARSLNADFEEYRKSR